MYWFFQKNHCHIYRIFKYDNDNIAFFVKKFKGKIISDRIEHESQKNREDDPKNSLEIKSNCLSICIVRQRVAASMRAYKSESTFQ